MTLQLNVNLDWFVELTIVVLIGHLDTTVACNQPWTTARPTHAKKVRVIAILMMTVKMDWFVEWTIVVQIGHRVMTVA